MGLSCSSLKKTKSKSKPTIAKPALIGIRPAQLLTLPRLLFTSRSHFAIDNTTITRSSENFDPHLYINNSSILLKAPITTGILSVTLVILSLPNVGYGPGGIMIGLLDSTAPVPEVAQCLGIQMKNSVSISSSSGLLWIHRLFVQDDPQHESCHFFLKEGDCVRMEVDMDSTPRTVHFFVNGESGRCFVTADSVELSLFCLFKTRKYEVSLSRPSSLRNHSIYLPTHPDQSTVLQVIKDGHPVDDESSKKAKDLFVQIGNTYSPNSDDFIRGLVPSSHAESAKEFVTSMVVLTSSANQIPVPETLDLLIDLIMSSSSNVHLSLINLNLVPQLLSSLNPQSLSFEDAPDVVLFVASLLSQLLQISSPHSLIKLEIENNWDRSALHDTTLAHLLVPSEGFIRHVCLNRPSFEEKEISLIFMSLLMQILHISPYHPPTMDFIQTLPIVLSIPSMLTSCPSDQSKFYCLTDLLAEQTECIKRDGSNRRSNTIVARFLANEGFSDVLEQMMMADEEGDSGSYIVACSISLSCMFGINPATLDYGVNLTALHRHT
ncbi:hypothetical protein BLNAU_21817 [Blattamonas nauphoetae]|uniref:DUF4704 domain-containing protein n=1 Tax=Blattamonas nauphoetae TaxID=2049346 RepID=A0ABQ9WUS4_9EUKA|nr:hypothetical protein BLNAU_21817 [Blattamonas nauphoetae]